MYAAVNKAIAIEILKQLGGNSFAAMTGANRFQAVDSGLVFFIPRSKNIRKIQIVLTAEDLYTVAFYSMHGDKTKLLGSKHAVDCNQLQKTFTEVTGLYTSL